jgi:ubiquinone/menaquinone biosynthesis C-methylase UbiE
MSHLYELESFVMRLIPKDRKFSVIDVGCGKGIWGYLLRALRENVVYLCGVDITPSYLQFIKERNVYDDLILCDSVFLPFRDGSFDLVLLSEVLEHLEKKQAYVMLKQLESIARQLILITVPQGLVKQEAIGGISAEKHRSAWYANDFKKLGYKVVGIGCRLVKYHFAEQHTYLWGATHYIFTPIAYLMPEIAGFLVCFKEPHSHR